MAAFSVTIKDFSSSTFDIKTWINETLTPDVTANYIADTSLLPSDDVIAATLTTLQLHSASVQQSLTGGIDYCRVVVPRVSQDIDRFMADASSLREVVGGIRERVESSEGRAQASVKGLRELDHIRRQLEQCRLILHQAETFKGVEKDVETTIADLERSVGITTLAKDSISQGAEVTEVSLSRLRQCCASVTSLTSCLTILNDIPSFEGGEPRVLDFRRRLTRVVVKLLCDCTGTTLPATHKEPALRDRAASLVSIGRILGTSVLTELETCCVSRRRQHVVALWRHYSQTGRGEDWNEWLPDFYHQIVLCLEEESLWFRSVLQNNNDNDENSSALATCYDVMTRAVTDTTAASVLKASSSLSLSPANFDSGIVGRALCTLLIDAWKDDIVKSMTNIFQDAIKNGNMDTGMIICDMMAQFCWRIIQTIRDDCEADMDWGRVVTVIYSPTLFVLSKWSDREVASLKQCLDRCGITTMVQKQINDVAINNMTQLLTLIQPESKIFSNILSSVTTVFDAALTAISRCADGTGMMEGAAVIHGITLIINRLIEEMVGFINALRRRLCMPSHYSSHKSLDFKGKSNEGTKNKNEYENGKASFGDKKPSKADGFIPTPTSLSSSSTSCAIVAALFRVLEAVDQALTCVDYLKSTTTQVIENCVRDAVSVVGDGHASSHLSIVIPSEPPSSGGQWYFLYGCPQEAVARVRSLQLLLNLNSMNKNETNENRLFQPCYDELLALRKLAVDFMLDALTLPVRLLTEDIIKGNVWSDPSSSSSSDLAFSASPSAEVTRLGDYLLSLPRLIEGHVAVAERVGGLDPLLPPSLVSHSSTDNLNSDDTNDDSGFVSRWLACVANTTIDLLIDVLVTIASSSRRLTSLGERQAAADITYTSNVCAALGADVAKLSTAEGVMAVSVEELTLMLKSEEGVVVSGDRRIVEIVAHLRGVVVD